MQTPRLSGSVSILVVLECALEDNSIPPTNGTIYGFNPCCFGMRPRRKQHSCGPQSHQEFQSLLFWNAPSKPARAFIDKGDIQEFQSLLFWNAPSKFESARRRGLMKMFQSLLFWNAPSKLMFSGVLMLTFDGFNPCCFGMRPRREVD